MKLHLQGTEGMMSAAGGLSLLSSLVDKHTGFRKEVDLACPVRHGTRVSEHSMVFLGAMSTGSSDFAGVERFDNNEATASILKVWKISAESTLRQSFESNSEELMKVFEKVNEQFLISARPHLSVCETGHVVVDADNTVLDQTGSNKENTGWTSKQCLGFNQLNFTIGEEGYLIVARLGPGNQHCQKGFPGIMEQAIGTAKKITDKPLLLRTDSGFDAMENMATVFEMNERRETGQVTDFLIKRNRRSDSCDELVKRANETGQWTETRPGESVCVLDEIVEREWNGRTYRLRLITKITEMTAERDGSQLLMTEHRIAQWWTSLDIPAEEVIKVYDARGTSEQFHSELKSDLDLERLPSSKFATNCAVVSLGKFLYNVLRYMSQYMLETKQADHEKKYGRINKKKLRVKRRRIRTVIQEFIHVSCKIVKTARRTIMKINREWEWFGLFKEMYNSANT